MTEKRESQQMGFEYYLQDVMMDADDAPAARDLQYRFGCSYDVKFEPYRGCPQTLSAVGLVLKQLHDRRKEQVKSTLNDAQLPFMESSDGVLVVGGGAVRIFPPYAVADCQGSNDMVLARVQQVLEDFVEEDTQFFDQTIKPEILQVRTMMHTCAAVCSRDSSTCLPDCCLFCVHRRSRRPARG